MEEVEQDKQVLPAPLESLLVHAHHALHLTLVLSHGVLQSLSTSADDRVEHLEVDLVLPFHTVPDHACVKAHTPRDVDKFGLREITISVLIVLEELPKKLAADHLTQPFADSRNNLNAELMEVDLIPGLAANPVNFGFLFQASATQAHLPTTRDKPLQVQGPVARRVAAIECPAHGLPLFSGQSFELFESHLAHALAPDILYLLGHAKLHALQPVTKWRPLAHEGLPLL
mmetsp:Transcript_60263/g.152538  ORF Transcript_60263/g.152538 Transcript_60263/m.152538 type:complete len:229 (-) Transcript_60263:686-1372(-)